MSYDLYLYKHKNSGLTEDLFSEYLTKNLKHNISDNPHQWIYENPETGVCFWFDWNEPNTEEADIQLFDKFDDFINLNFNFGINFFRANFFGMETFPILEKILEENNLWVLNPQDDKNTDFPEKFEPNYLKNQWINHNEQVIREHYEEMNFEYYPLDKSNFIWRYLSNREKLQNNLIEDIFIPSYFMIKGNTDGKLYTGCVWPEHIPIILPPVDLVIIKKTIKSFFKTKEESGIILYQAIMNKFEKYFEPFENEISNLKVLRPEKAKLISAEFNKLPLIEIKKFGVGVSFDRFVNIPPFDEIT
ncbi:hypothetical protein B6A10_09420 [Flavobacterium sp. L1I52]|uniref:Uncharacterized protein n=1 Tax=Flavobacterium pokkalii TaxID=1940408 RepID=A0ABR7URW0_9FLAO|nr:hypothetical protein [Flavobacterium pokkalii]MBD0725397.1 hypothetical protein [Flavobacterium pokkalii]